MVGPFDGKLDNGGETLRLERPDEPPEEEPDFVPFVLEDEVTYDDEPPWPLDADGEGDSLERLTIGLWGNDAASWTNGTPTPGEFVVRPTVIGRHVFYDNSWFDDATFGRGDDDAIATDPATASDPRLGKTALLPGQTATFLNYTSYSLGINGIMIDVAGLPNPVTPSLSNFLFRVGNNDDPGSWPAAPEPEGIVGPPGSRQGRFGPNRDHLARPRDREPMAASDRAGGRARLGPRRRLLLGQRRRRVGGPRQPGLGERDRRARRAVELQWTVCARGDHPSIRLQSRWAGQCHRPASRPRQHDVPVDRAAADHGAGPADSSVPACTGHIAYIILNSGSDFFYFQQEEGRKLGFFISSVAP